MICATACDYLPRMTSTMGERLKKARKLAGFGSAQEAADAMEIRASTYRAHENGQNEFDHEIAEQYGRKFRVRPAWLLTAELPMRPGGTDAGTGDLSYHPASAFDETPSQQGDEVAAFSTVAGNRGIPPDTIPHMDVDAHLGAGGFSQVVQVTRADGTSFSADQVRDYWRVPDWWLRSFGTSTRYVFALTAEGDSMQPRIMAGDIVFVDTRRKVPSPDGLYAIVDEFGGVVVKRLTNLGVDADSGAVRIEIASDNPTHRARVRNLDEISIIGRFLARMTEH